MIRKIENITHRVAVAAVAMALCWSCSQDGQSVDGDISVSNGNSSEIKFDVAEAILSSRASIATTADNMTSFDVYANSDERTDIFAGETVSKDSDGAWTYTNVQQWKSGETANFFAYSPSATVSSAALNSSSSSLSFGYTVEADTDEADAVDLLVAAKAQDNSTSSNVELAFDHALAAVGFAIKGSAEIEVEINSIEIKSAYKTATATVTLEDGISWGDHSTTMDYMAELIDIRTTTSDGELLSITADDGYTIVMPQTLAATYLEVEYTVNKATSSKTKYFMLSGDEWEPSTIYTYNIDFSGLTVDDDLGNIEFEISVSPWGIGSVSGDMNTSDGLAEAPGGDIDLDVYNTYDKLVSTVKERLGAGVTDFVVTGEYFVGALGQGCQNDWYIYERGEENGYSDEERQAALERMKASPLVTYIIDDGEIISATTIDISQVTGIYNEYEELNAIPAYTFADAYCYLTGNETTKYTEIIMPDYITKFGHSLFAFNKTITNVSYSGVEILDESVFWLCSNLESADLPDVTTVLTGSQFSSCTSLISVNMPKLEMVEGSMFYTCSSLKVIDLPSVTTVEGHAFSDCTSLETANFPSVTYLWGSAFYEAAEGVTLYLTSEESIELTDTYSTYKTYNLVLNENKSTEVTNLIWQNQTWYSITYGSYIASDTASED